MLASKASRLPAFAAPSFRCGVAPFGALLARRPLNPLSLRNLNKASLLATVLLPLFTVSMASAAASSAAGACPDSSAPIPAHIQAAADDILQMYRTKSVEEQGNIVAKHYAANARFVDPLMDVGTLREIHLAFYSLIRIFKDVEVHKKSMVWNTTPRLPSGFTAGTQQVVLYNQQTYALSKRTIDLDVSTYLTFNTEGKVVRHEDVWNNSSFGMPGLLKRPNGVLSSGIFKLLGWGKQVDGAKA